MNGTAPPVSIHLDAVTWQANGREVLCDVSIQAHSSRIGVVGRNGSGKSTLARLMAGLLRPNRGRLSIDGIDPARDRKAALRTLGILFQNPEHQIIFPTVCEEIAFGLRQLGQSRDQAGDEVRRILARFDRAHWHDAPVSALSQGQKHLVCMMAVLAMRPRLLILDEPFAGLDIPTRRQLQRQLDRAGVAVVHISHDPADLDGYDRLFWLDRGRIAAQGPASEVLPRFTAEMNRLGELDDLADLAG